MKTLKTQLLQDFDESGSAPLTPCTPRPHPRGAAPTTASRGMPEMPAMHESPGLPDMPAWLAERLREDAEYAARRHDKQAWTRRALAWSAAATAAAMLAVAGFWLHEQSRMEDALVVVANTSPAPALPSPTPALPLPAPLPAPLADRAATATDAARHVPAGVEEHAPVEPVATAATIRRPRRAQASSTRQREATLIQCRALGYDERQCRRRGCAMTRFGLACRG